MRHANVHLAMDESSNDGQKSYNDLKQEVVSLNAKLSEQQAYIDALLSQVRYLKNHVFGTRSERFIPDDTQPALFSLPEVKKEEKEELTTTVTGYERKARRGRKPLPKNLPRERIEYEAEDTQCPCCHEEMPKIGEEVTEELEYVPARFKIVEHVKIKRACPKCKETVVQGSLPAGVPVIEKGRPGPGLLSHIMISKYCDHLPLHRQEQMFARHGIEIPRQRMCDWIGTVVEQILLLIALSLKKSIRASSYIRADETELEVQTEEKDGKLHKGRLWGMLSYEKDVYFEYAPTRSSEVAKSLLSGIHACLQTDQYGGYDVLGDEPDIIRFGCWDHVRRRFFKAKESAHEHAKEALRQIGELYKVEREYKEKLKAEKRPLVPEERVVFRREKCRPLLDELKAYLDSLSVATLPKSPLGEAVSYALRDWGSLSNFVEHGLVELSNAGIEQQIRPIALGRNNWYFAGNERGAKWAAVIYSIIGTCKLNKINPHEYLVDILRRAPGLKQSSIELELTPRAWMAARAVERK